MLGTAVGVGRSETPWAFFAVAGTRDGAPRWLLLETDKEPMADLHLVTARLRELLLTDTPLTDFDQPAVTWLNRFLRVGERAETQLLPRRDQRALTQLRECCTAWADGATLAGQFELAQRLRDVRHLVEPVEEGEQSADLHQVAAIWWELTRAHREAFRQRNRRRRYTTLSDIDGALQNNPLAIQDVEHALSELILVEPFDRRVSACILGAPSP